MQQTHHIKTEKDMMAFGGEMATACKDRCIIYLQGELGAGKTTLVRGFLRALGHKGHVKSPTYTVVEPYSFPDKQIYHFDFYRIHNPEELEHLGIRDYFADPAICLIEWPELAKGKLPEPDITCQIEMETNGRKVSVLTKNPG